MTGLQHPLVQDYLARLDRAAAGLPPAIRAELVADLTAHLDTAVGAGTTDAEVRNVLQELGAPEDVAAAAYDGAAGPAPVVAPTPGGPVWPTPPPSPWGPVEMIAVIGLTAGTFLVPFVGPVVGLVMAWVSDKWTRTEKVVATVLTLAPVVVLAIGLLGLVVASSGSSSGGSAPTPISSSPTAGGQP